MTTSHSNLTHYEISEIKRALWGYAKYRSSKNGLEFTITPSDIFVPSCCPVLGTEFKRGDVYKAPSLDRIDSSRGYVKGNVIVVSRRANVLKSNATLAELQALSKFYTELDSKLTEILKERELNDKRKSKNKSTKSV